MKKIALLLSLFSVFTVNAQFSFTDDFESYSVGNYIAAADTLWVVWPAAGAEDVQVTDNNAFSGSNSIYLNSTAATGGGPQDVVLEFGELFDEGDFMLSANFYVNNNTGGYFNFQGETTIGETWSMDCFMNDDGSIEFSTGGGGTVFLESNYPFDTWFNITMNINLTLNQWQVMIDNQLVGTFENTINQVASLNLYPLSGNQYYIDDVSVSHVPFNPIGINAILSDLNVPSYVQFPADIDISGTVLNYGAETIESMDIIWTDGTDTYTDNITGVSIASLETYDFTHSDQLSFTTADTANITVSIENINSGTDVDDINNILSTEIYSLEFVAQRLPLYEHFTSNTCGPCASFNPGFQNLLDANDVNQIGNAKVACIKYQVNWPGTGDQSFNEDVGTRVSHYGVSGVPSAHIDGTTTSSSQDEIDEHRNIPSFLDITATAVATDGTDLAVDVSVSSYYDYPSTKIHIAVVENVYSNTAGSNGETEFYQVLRKMLPSANGTSANLSNGNSTTVSESYTFAMGNVTQNSFRIWEDLSNCVVVVFVEDQGTKKVLDSRIFEITGNTNVTPTWECQATGCVDPGTGDGEYSTLADCEAQCVSDIAFWNAIDIKLMPNPAQNNFLIELNLSSQNVLVSIYSITGKRVSEFDYGSLEGKHSIPINISTLQSGIYTVKIQLDNEVSIHKLIKQ
ncbi:MAG: hypothetical protein CMP64_06150 [Flavobacteriales bacterium]|nr:hypothetical protein [Flavobacteriales bacterium]